MLTKSPLSGPPDEDTGYIVQDERPKESRLQHLATTPHIARLQRVWSMWKVLKFGGTCYKLL